MSQIPTWPEIIMVIGVVCCVLSIPIWAFLTDPDERIKRGNIKRRFIGNKYFEPLYEKIKNSTPDFEGWIRISPYHRFNIHTGETERIGGDFYPSWHSRDPEEWMIDAIDEINIQRKYNEIERIGRTKIYAALIEYMRIWTNEDETILLPFLWRNIGSWESRDRGRLK